MQEVSRAHWRLGGVQEHGSALSRDDLAGGRVRTGRQETARPQQQPALGSSPMDASGRTARDPEDGRAAPG